MTRISISGAAVLLAASLLAGCDTEDELLKQRIAMLKAEEAAIRDVQTQLQSANDFEGPGVASMFLSTALLNSVLAVADGVVVPVPNMEGTFVTLNSLRTDFRIGFPLVAVSADARKEGLAAKLSLVGTARLEATVEPGTPQKLALRVHVDSLVPRAQWSAFDFQLGGFVRDLAQVKLSDEARKVGTIRMPLETDLALALPAKITPVVLSGTPVNLSTPELSLKAKVAVTRILTLPDGLHVYAKITPAGAV